MRKQMHSDPVETASDAQLASDPQFVVGGLPKRLIGSLPVNALEKPADIMRFKAAFRKVREIATVNRALSPLRSAISWVAFRPAVPDDDAVPPIRREYQSEEETKPGSRYGLSQMATTRSAPNPVRVDREKLRQIDLHWHDLRACGNADGS
jgi:hypothetical protein